MTPIFQKIYHPVKGDCLRTAIASLFDLEHEQVPHFRLFSKDQERYVLSGFYWAMGYDWIKCGYPDKEYLSYDHSVNGLFEASVKSGKDLAHAVLIDMDGIVIHDPDKSQRFKGVNVFESNIIIWWTILNKIMIPDSNQPIR